MSKGLADATQIKLKRSLDKRSSKFRHAVAFVEYMSQIFSDAIPTYGNIKAIPFESVSELYTEYEHQCQARFTPVNLFARINTFRKAFASLKDSIRLLGCKGSFQTCDICNCANDLLKSKSCKFSKEQREAILKWKRLHLLLQAEERDELDKNRNLAKNEKEMGQYKYAFFLADGMTQYTTNTPRVGSNYRKGKQDSAVLGTRVIGVEVVCGPIDEVFLFLVDDLVGGGANLMIEIQRQAILDLSRRLAAFNLEMPKSLFLQFDNCGENKNKEMFSYCSLLVQERYFESIACNFLIVGHTHCSIDQYFGIISKIIKSCPFIGSPLALVNLLSTIGSQQWKIYKPDARPDSTARTPTVVRYIRLVHDYRSAMKPYIVAIKYYQIPHNFRFQRLDANIPVATCQYRLYRSHKFLPLAPKEFHGTLETIFSLCKEAIELETFSIVGSEAYMNNTIFTSLYDERGSALSAADLIGNKLGQEEVVLASAMKNTFENLVLSAMDAQEQRFADEQGLDATVVRAR